MLQQIWTNPNRVNLVCVDSYDEGVLKGRFYNPGGDAECFSSLAQFLLKMEELLDITPGSLSVMGLMNDKERKVQLLIDEEVLEEEYIGCHPCINTSSIRFTKEDLMEKIIPAMGHEPKMVRL